MCLFFSDTSISQSGRGQKELKGEMRDFFGTFIKTLLFMSDWSSSVQVSFKRVQIRVRPFNIQHWNDIHNTKSTKVGDRNYSTTETL